MGMSINIRNLKVGTLLTIGIIAIIGSIISATIYTNYLTSNAQNTIRKSTLRMFDVFTIQHRTDDLFSNLDNLDLIIEIEDLDRSDKSVKSKIERSRQTVEESKQKDVLSPEELERIEDLVDDAETTADEIIRLKRKIIEGGLEYDEFGLSLRTEDTKDLKDQFEIVRYLQFEVKEVVGGVVGRSDIEFRQAMRVVERASILTWVVIGISLVLAGVLAYYLIKSVKKIYDLKNEFVNIIAHDLRNPVTAITGYLEMVSSQKNKKVSELGEDLLAMTVSAQKLKIQISNLLEVGRTEAGRQKLNLESVNPLDVIGESVLRAKALAQVSSIKITHKEENGKSAYVLADRNKLSDVLDNLISNAIKYNSEKGTVTINTKDESDKFSISVTDTGKGIPDNQKNKIFKRYSRLDTDKGKRVSGTGLGLYTVKLAMDQMEGTVGFVSKTNEGTTFTAIFKKVDKNFKDSGSNPPEDKDKEGKEEKKS
jgi:anti-sigma regulatory factor (Ser/Thr protein kinase)